MKIKMDNLVITEYCSNDKEKYHFIKDVSEDKLIKKYVSNNMDEWLEDSEGLDKIYVGPAYIIEDKEKLVGFIRLSSLNKDGVLDLHYATHPVYRKQNYGTKILLEVSKYIFKNILSINKIELHIKEINIGSIKCAKKAKFKFDREYIPRYDDCKVKVYSMKK